MESIAPRTIRIIYVYIYRPSILWNEGVSKQGIPITLLSRVDYQASYRPTSLISILAKKKKSKPVLPEWVSLLYVDNSQPIRVIRAFFVYPFL